MALPSIEPFLELVRKSQVIEPNRLTAYLDQLRAADEMPSDPARLAELMVRDGLLTKFQAEFLQAGKWRGFHLGKYKLLEKIGSGGMGTVYLAEHKFMKRRVAIKVLPKSKANDSSSKERFYREARAIAALDHPNIVRAYDIDHDPTQDVHFLVMEFVDGGSLQDIVRAHGPMSVERATNYMAQSALGLQHAHELGLVHRDIKPGNVLIDRTGCIKVLDMGLARFFHDNEDMLTRKYDENVLGTADYLAPEQALDSHTVDIRADIYSLGCTFYFVLTGKSPFGEGSVAQKLIWHQTRRPKSLKEWQPEVPDELVAIIDKMMSKSPGDRYQLPSEVVEALAPFNVNPIPPPPLEEMPVLCLAAGGGTDPGSGTAPGSSVSSRPLVPKPKEAGSGSSLRRGTAPSAPGSAVRGNGGTIPRELSPARMAEQPTGATGSGSGSARPLAASATSEANQIVSPTQPTKIRPSPKIPAQRPAAPASTAAPASPVIESSPWTELTSDTDAHSAQAQDTMKNSGRRLRRREAAMKSRWSDPGFRRTAIIAGVIGGGVLLILSCVGIYYLFIRETPHPISPLGSGGGGTTATQPVPEKPGTKSGVIYVSKNKLDPNDVDTLAAAISKASATGGRIVVRDQEVYEERLDILGAQVRRGLSIEAERDANGNTATIRAPKDTPAGEALIYIDRLEGFRLKGFNLDGARRADEMIRLRGNSAGTALEELRLKGFNRTGVNLEACNALRGREVLLRDIWVEPDRDKGQPAMVGLNFSQPPSLGTGGNSHIVLQNCRFTGPYEQVVRIGTSLVKVAFERCVFVGGGKQGFLYPSVANPELVMDFRVEHCTFALCDTGLNLQQQPSLLSSNIFLNDNLFYKVKEAVVSLRPDFAPKLAEVLQGEGNCHDKSSKPGNVQEAGLPKFKLQAQEFQLPTGSPIAVEYLRYPKSSPLAKAGRNGTPLGALDPLP
jgi:serine/threonine protein kinase